MGGAEGTAARRFLVVTIWESDSHITSVLPTTHPRSRLARRAVYAESKTRLSLGLRGTAPLFLSRHDRLEIAWFNREILAFYSTIQFNLLNRNLSNPSPIAICDCPARKPNPIYTEPFLNPHLALRRVRWIGQRCRCLSPGQSGYRITCDLHLMSEIAAVCNSNDIRHRRCNLKPAITICEPLVQLEIPHVLLGKLQLSPCKVRHRLVREDLPSTRAIEIQHICITRPYLIQPQMVGACPARSLAYRAKRIASLIPCLRLHNILKVGDRGNFVGSA